MHGLEQVRLRSPKCFLHGNATGETERKLRAVDAMVAAVDQADLAVDDLEAERAFHHRLADTVFNGGYPLARNGATGSGLIAWADTTGLFSRPAAP